MYVHTTTRLLKYGSHDTPTPKYLPSFATHSNDARIGHISIDQADDDAVQHLTHLIRVYGARDVHEELTFRVAITALVKTGDVVDAALIALIT